MLSMEKGFELLKNCAATDLTITASFPLPVANSLALEQALDTGASRATGCVELDKGAMETFVSRGGSRVEQFMYGRLPLLTTRAEIPIRGVVRDARGEEFIVIQEDGLVKVLPGDPMSLPEPAGGLSRYIDLSHAPLDPAGTTSRFNHDHDLL